MLRASASGHDSESPEDFTVGEGEVKAFEIELESYGGGAAVIDLKKHEPAEMRQTARGGRLKHAGARLEQLQ